MRFDAASTERMVVAVRSLLGGLEFDDPHTAGAGNLAKAAELLGLVVVYDEYGTPVRIEAS